MAVERGHRHHVGHLPPGGTRPPHRHRQPHHLLGLVAAGAVRRERDGERLREGQVRSPPGGATHTERRRFAPFVANKSHRCWGLGQD